MKNARLTRTLTRRQAIAAYGSLLAASPLSVQELRAQEPIGEPPGPIPPGPIPPGLIPPVQELVNAAEFEAVARRKLDSPTFTEIAGSERGAFDRITFRPRLMIDSRQMDLTTGLFGQSLFTPVLIGPLSRQKRFHPEGELATARGASAARAVMVVADRSSYPIDQIAAQAKTPLWYQVNLEPDINDAEPDINQVRTRVERAVGTGCTVLCVTVGGETPRSPLTAGIDWSAIDRLRKGIAVPVVLKGVMSPEEARKAVAGGVEGIVVSGYAARSIPGVASPIEMLPSIADAVGGKVPILIDGSFRLGSDVLKALALGARAVLLGRPVLWGLAAYGAEGVQSVIELIQSGFARDMAMCGQVSVKSLDRTVVKIHRR
ncbi:MAG TPA: alpha-hydroxy-acid oxidizing protein [Candidatus Solibacter sp.]|nr:alpha-hydroxy-acid oxidizing protein [Candidatus Solibacter sp.]